MSLFLIVASPPQTGGASSGLQSIALNRSLPAGGCCPGSSDARKIATTSALLIVPLPNSPASAVSPSPFWSVLVGTTSHTRNLRPTVSFPSGPGASGTSVEPSLVPEGAMIRSRYIWSPCAVAGTGTESVPSNRVAVRCGLKGENQPTSSVAKPSFVFWLGGGRLGSWTKPTEVASGGAVAMGSTVALNWSVATSTPAAKRRVTLQVAVAPGPAAQSVTCRVDPGGIVVDVGGAVGAAHRAHVEDRVEVRAGPAGLNRRHSRTGRRPLEDPLGSGRLGAGARGLQGAGPARRPGEGASGRGDDVAGEAAAPARQGKGSPTIREGDDPARVIVDLQIEPGDVGHPRIASRGRPVAA